MGALPACVTLLLVTAAFPWRVYMSGTYLLRLDLRFVRHPTTYSKFFTTKHMPT